MFSKILAFILLLFFFMQDASAGAWVQDPGQGLSISVIKHYVSTHFRTSNGTLTSAPRFAKYEVDQYFEFGVNTNLTLGAYFSGISTHPATPPGITGSNDNEILARYQIWRGKNSVISAQTFADFFGKAASANIPPQNTHVNTGEAILYGTGGSFGKKSSVYWFFDTSNGIIQRYGAGDQAQINLEAGIKLFDQKLWVFLQSYNTLSLVNPTQPKGTNYDQFTLVPSLVYWVKKPFALQAGISQDIYARNLGVGTAPFLAAWFTF